MIKPNLRAGARPSHQVADMKATGAVYYSPSLDAQVWLWPDGMRWKFQSDKYTSDEVQGSTGEEKAWAVLSNADDWQDVTDWDNG